MEDNYSKRVQVQTHTVELDFTKPVGITLGHTSNNLNACVCSLKQDGQAESLGLHIGDILLMVNSHKVYGTLFTKILKYIKAFNVHQGTCLTFGRIVVE